MKRSVVLMCVLLCICGSAGAQINDLKDQKKLTGAQRSELEKDLERFLLNKILIAKATFPAFKDGINLKTDGTWDNKLTTRLIKNYGVGIEVDEKATVTNVKLGDRIIEIHLNGGGVGTFGDVLLAKGAKKPTGGKAPGGSRINLQFARNITKEDVEDLSRLVLLC